MDCSANCTPLDREIAGTLVPGDEQEKAITARNSLVERLIDCPPGAIEAHPVEVDDAVGLDASVTKAPIPVPV